MKKVLSVILIFLALNVFLISCGEKKEVKVETVTLKGEIVSNYKSLVDDNYVNVIKLDNGDVWTDISSRQIVQTNEIQHISMGSKDPSKIMIIEIPALESR